MALVDRSSHSPRPPLSVLPRYNQTTELMLTRLAPVRSVLQGPGVKGASAFGGGHNTERAINLRCDGTTDTQASETSESGHESTKVLLVDEEHV